MTEPELIESLKVHRFEPGDRLVVQLKEGTFPTAHYLERLRETVRSWVPDDVRVLVLPDSVGVEVVRVVSAEVTPERMAELKKEWEKQYGGLSNAKEPERA